MRRYSVLIWLTSFIYLLSALEIPHPVVKVKGSEVSIMVPGEIKGIDSIFFQVELVNEECDANAYAYRYQSPWRANIELQKTIEPNANLRVHSVVEINKQITTQLSVYKIIKNGMGELTDEAKNVLRADLKYLAAKCQLVKKDNAHGVLLFEDNFDDNQKLTDNWQHEVRYRNTGGKNQEFVAFVDDSMNSNITNNKLHITITKAERETILQGCTSKKEGIEKRKECDILLVPTIGTLDCDFVDHIRLYARGNEILQDKHQAAFDGTALFGGLVVWNKTGGESNPTEHFIARNEVQYYADAFHDYSIIWQEDKIAFKVDGEFFGAITNATLLKAFNKHECHIVLGLTAGGNVNFNDDVLEMKQKPFSNTHPKADKQFEELSNNSNWTPLVVDYIRVYAIDENRK
ncbi:gram-negative bacteria-binding protein 2 [Drosophila eugracilis]|uniref:gram-negative bacteria-binding protein 2 n=1 Tax=Drosophila eugracilis TaxID=29029 RepID=UPI0007E6D765|nr:gram-negative bacteria-binding protein 2 [Drosophila eugracilis]